MEFIKKHYLKIIICLVIMFFASCIKNCTTKLRLYIVVKHNVEMTAVNDSLHKVISNKQDSIKFLLYALDIEKTNVSRQEQFTKDLKESVKNIKSNTTIKVEAVK